MENCTALLVVLDAVGIDTLEYLLSKYNKKVNLKNLSSLGLSNLLNKKFETLFKDFSLRKAYYKKIKQVSKTADSLVGHREMMGVIDNRTYELFYNGFPENYLKAIEKAVGRKTFFNKMAGGVEAIELNASHHEKTGDLIVYASKCDPLIQIAMNEDIIPVKEQHFIADTAFRIGREMNIPITRCIARSYIKRNGEIIRTSNRHDAVLPVEQKTLIEILNENFIWTSSVGKTSDLVNVNYSEKIKLTNKIWLDPKLKLRFVHPKEKDTNPFSMQGTLNALIESKAVYRPKGTFIFSNLVDTDSLYGHTRDVFGAIRAIEEFDRNLDLLFKNMEKGDLLMITADHGMQHRDDYGYHNNEELPFLAYRKGYDSDLGAIKTDSMPGLTDIGNIIAQYFDLEKEYKKIVMR
jgi:phosphopentomutase